MPLVVEAVEAGYSIAGVTNYLMRENGAKDPKLHPNVGRKRPTYPVSQVKRLSPLVRVDWILQDIATLADNAADADAFQELRSV